AGHRLPEGPGLRHRHGGGRDPGLRPRRDLEPDEGLNVETRVGKAADGVFGSSSPCSSRSEPAAPDDRTKVLSVNGFAPVSLAHTKKGTPNHAARKAIRSGVCGGSGPVHVDGCAT